MFKFISAFMFTLLPVLCAADERIVTEHLEIKQTKPHYFGIYKKNDKSLVGSHEFTLSDDKQKVSTDYTKAVYFHISPEETNYGTEALIAITKFVYEPLFGQHLEGAERSFEAADYSADTFHETLPCFFPLLQAGFKFSGAIGFTYTFTYTDDKTIFSAATQEDMKTAFGLLQPKLIQCKNLMDLLQSKLHLFSGSDVNNATNILIRVINREEDARTCHALTGFLAHINENNDNKALRDLVVKYAPLAGSVDSSELHPNIKGQVETLATILKNKAAVLPSSTCTLL